MMDPDNPTGRHWSLTLLSYLAHPLLHLWSALEGCKLHTVNHPIAISVGLVEDIIDFL